MTPTLKISQTVVNRLLNVKKPCFGKLYGIMFKNNLVVVGLNIEQEENVDVHNYFPAEIDMCGVLEVSSEGTTNETQINKSLRDVFVTDNPIFTSVKISEPNDIQTSYVVNDRLEKIPFETITQDDLNSDFVHMRLKVTLPLVSEMSQECIKDAIVNLRKLLSSGYMAFMFEKKNIYLLGNDHEGGIVGITGDPTVGELCDVSSESSEGCTKKKKQEAVAMEVLGVNMLKRITVEGSNSLTKSHGPVFLLDKRHRRTLVMSIVIDALSMVHKQTKVINLYEILIESSARNLRLVESNILKQLEQTNTIKEPEVYHFYPDACGHFVTLVYSNLEDDAAPLRAERLKLHEQFLLPLNRPFFKRTNRFLFKGEALEMDGILMNPHEGIHFSGNNGEIALVKGKYCYYHYCQNGMDDNGWGCAYRSLQTLASWFLLQGYTDRPVPTFREIQQCLVDIGDKPHNFVGSRQWIGSTEVSYVLDSLLGVTSKILFVNSGEEMGSKGAELLYHFQTNGSPIMIGGGVLAHTILGVDYNRQTGNLKFLILDPHYTGSDDLKIIQNKGWCGWKGVEFWDKTSYYNMCLPQVPKGV